MSARKNRRGIHRREFIEPWNWRCGERLKEEDTFTAIASRELNVYALADRMLHGEDANVYGHWLDDSVFAIMDDTVAVSLGGSPGTNPAEIGGGVWKGALVGLETRSRERVDANAAIEIDDFARPDVDIAFTSIQNVGARAKSDINWKDIPVGQGAFWTRDMAGSIEGRF